MSLRNKSSQPKARDRPRRRSIRFSIELPTGAFTVTSYELAYPAGCLFQTTPHVVFTKIGPPDITLSLVSVDENGMRMIADSSNKEDSLLNVNFIIHYKD
jgi:hypothetical protein